MTPAGRRRLAPNLLARDPAARAALGSLTPLPAVQGAGPPRAPKRLRGPLRSGQQSEAGQEAVRVETDGGRKGSLV